MTQLHDAESAARAVERGDAIANFDYRAERVADVQTQYLRAIACALVACAAALETQVEETRSLAHATYTASGP